MLIVRIIANVSGPARPLLLRLCTNLALSWMRRNTSLLVLLQSEKFYMPPPLPSYPKQFSSQRNPHPLKVSCLSIAHLLSSSHALPKRSVLTRSSHTSNDHFRNWRHPSASLSPRPVLPGSEFLSFRLRCWLHRSYPQQPPLECFCHGDNQVGWSFRARSPAANHRQR